MDRQLTERMVGAALLLGALVVIVPLILDGKGRPVVEVGPDAAEPINLRTHTIHLDGTERAPPVPQAFQEERVVAPPASSLPASAPPEPSIPEPSVISAIAPAAGSPASDAVVSDPVPATPAAAKAPAPSAAQDAGPAIVAAVPKAPAPSPAPDTATTAATSKAPERPAATGSWYVQLGSFSSRANADRLAAEVGKKGFPTAVSPSTGGSGKTLYRVRAGGVPSRDDAAKLAERLASAGYRGQIAR